MTKACQICDRLDARARHAALTAAAKPEAEFKSGDRVLALGEVVALDGDEARVEFTEGGDGYAWVPLSSLQPAPPPPYVKPKLVPGMVIAPLDKNDANRWWVAEEPDGTLIFRRANDFAYGPESLPDEIRVVHDPRQATS